MGEQETEKTTEGLRKKGKAFQKFKNGSLIRSRMKIIIQRQRDRKKESEIKRQID